MNFGAHPAHLSQESVVINIVQMDTFSRINHKNFVNLLGHCEEDDPFVRMMVFEYASNGNLYEHLHGDNL